MNVQTPEGATEPLPCTFCQFTRINQLMRSIVNDSKKERRRRRWCEMEEKFYNQLDQFIKFYKDACAELRQINKVARETRRKGDDI
eukprot:8581181-Heterocapsa_arctica.AAC.1